MTNTNEVSMFDAGQEYLAPQNEEEMTQRVIALLNRIGFEDFGPTDIIYRMGDAAVKNHKGYYTLGMKYTNIYGSRTAMDIVLTSPKIPSGLALEIKWQKSVGTVDEKFPFLVYNILNCYPCEAAIVLIDGGGYRPGALKWLKAQAGHSRLAYVFSWNEFLQWVEDGGL